jgi:hypothetical protein
MKERFEREVPFGSIIKRKLRLIGYGLLASRFTACGLRLYIQQSLAVYHDRCGKNSPGRCGDAGFCLRSKRQFKPDFDIAGCMILAYALSLRLPLPGQLIASTDAPAARTVGAFPPVRHATLLTGVFCLLAAFLLLLCYFGIYTVGDAGSLSEAGTMAKIWSV